MSDGRRIVSGSKDQSLKVWDLVTLQCCLTLKGHTDLIWRVAVAFDDSFIVSASKDDMLKVSRLVFRLTPFCSHLELHDTVADIAEQPLCEFPHLSFLIEDDHSYLLPDLPYLLLVFVCLFVYLLVLVCILVSLCLRVYDSGCDFFALV